jgi:hypothetical protein
MEIDICESGGRHNRMLVQSLQDEVVVLYT